MVSRPDETPNDSVLLVFPIPDNFEKCAESHDVEESETKSRIDQLAMPTIRHIIASGLYALKTENKKHIRNLEKLLCLKMNQTTDYVEEFIAKHRPRTPVDSNKFSTDDLDLPVFYESSHMRYDAFQGFRINKHICYNYRGIPKRIPSKVLKYTPTNRILELSKPLRPKHHSETQSSIIRKSSVRSRTNKSLSESFMSVKAKEKSKRKLFKAVRSKSNKIKNRNNPVNDSSKPCLDSDRCTSPEE